MVGVGGIHKDVVDDDIGSRHAHEGPAAVHGLVQPFGGSGVDNLVILRVLLEHPGPPRGGGYARDLVEQLAGVLALVDAAASAQKGDLRRNRIEDDGENIRIVDQSPLDAVPHLAPVHGLPGQMPGAGKDDVWIVRIDGQRFDLMNFVATGWADKRPGNAGVGTAEDAFQGSGVEDRRIRRRLGKGADRLPAQSLDLAPGMAPVVAHPQAAVIAVRPPGGDVDGGRMGFIHDDMVENEAVGRADAGKTAPVRAGVRGFVNPTIGGAQVKVVGVSGDLGKGAPVTPVGANRAPWGLRRQGLPSQRNDPRRNSQRQPAAPAQRIRESLHSSLQTINSTAQKRKPGHKETHKTKEADRLPGQPQTIAEAWLMFAFAKLFWFRYNLTNAFASSQRPRRLTAGWRKRPPCGGGPVRRPGVCAPEA